MHEIIYYNQYKYFNWFLAGILNTKIISIIKKSGLFQFFTSQHQHLNHPPSPPPAWSLGRYGEKSAPRLTKISEEQKFEEVLGLFHLP